MEHYRQSSHTVYDLKFHLGRNKITLGFSRCVVDFEKNKQRVHNAEFRDRGLFVGSGLLETGGRMPYSHWAAVETIQHALYGSLGK